MQKSTNPLWGFAVLLLLAVEFGIRLAHDHFSDAAIVGIFLLPVVAWAGVWLYRHT